MGWHGHMGITLRRPSCRWGWQCGDELKGIPVWMQQQYHQFAQGQDSRGKGFGRLCHSRRRRDIDDMPSWRCSNNEKNAYRHQIQVGPRNLRTPSDWLYIHSSLRILVLRYTIHKFRRDFLVFCYTILKFGFCFLVFCYTIHKFQLYFLVFCYTTHKFWLEILVLCYTILKNEGILCPNRLISP